MRSFGLDVRAGPQVAAEFLVNDALVGEKRPGDASSHSLPIQHELLPGTNRAVVVAAPAGLPPSAPPRPVRAGMPDGVFIEMSLDADTVTDKGDSYDVATETIERRSWRPAAGSPAGVVPHRIEIAFEAPATLRPPVWTRATPVDAGHARAPVIAALEELQVLLAAGRLDEFEQRMQLRNEDMARAYPLLGGAYEHAGRDLAGLRDLFSVPGFRMALFGSRQLVVRGFAGGRLLEVRRPDGTAALMGGTPGEPPVGFAVAFSQIDGRMVPVR